MRRGVAGPRGGGVYLSRVQQTRLLDAALEVVVEEGVGRISSRRVSARAGMSTKTFYDLFADSEDCFLAVFDRAVDELAAVVAPAWVGEDEWVERVRAALIVLLAALERDPALARIVFVEALGAGPRVLARRAEVLDRVAGFIDEGRVDAPAAAGLPSLVAAGVAGAAFSIVHARLVEESPGSLMELVGPVMATVVLPYRGRESATRELARPVVPNQLSGSGLRTADKSRPPSRPRDLISGPAGRTIRSPLRLTARTCAVLAAVGELGGANNRQVAARAGASEPQISGLLARLAEHGLVENRGSGPGRFAKAWWLTPSGAEFLGDGRALMPSSASSGRGISDVEGGEGQATPPAEGVHTFGRSERGVLGTRASRSRTIGEDADRSEIGQRRPSSPSRLLEATFALVAEEGARDLTVGMVTARAAVSRRTFYESFSDLEDCLLAAFDHALDVLVDRVLPAYEAEGEWQASVRAGLGALLECLDGEPALSRLLFVEALSAGPRVLARRAQVLEQLAVVIDGGRGGDGAPEGVPLLVAEGVVGGVFGVIHARLFQRRPEPLVDLLDSLMATIVLPYRGSEAAARVYASDRERAIEDRPAPPVAALRPLGSALPADFRLTVRTQMALMAVARLSAKGANPTNKKVAESIGVSGKGQVSLLMTRLANQGLVEDTGGHGRRGAPKAWRLTKHGKAVLDAHRPGRALDTEDPGEIHGGKLAAKRGRRARSAPTRQANPGLRLTVRTHLVLIAVAEHVGASNREIADAAGVSDEGQISRLLARLNDHGLIRDAARASVGHAKAWQLTPQGEALLHAHRPHSSERAA
jgi:AcrR family transcriptional regulator/DNA-binding MarR family transcriptional regulator